MNFLIYERLREIKDKKNLTLQQVSEKSGVPFGTVSRIFSGQTANPSFQSIYDIAIAMGVSLDELSGLDTTDKNTISDDMKTVFEKTIAAKNAQIEKKDKWISRLFWICLILIFLILFAIIIDWLNKNIGFFWLYQ